MLTIRHATKVQAKARIALIGPSGSGKTMTALILAKELAEDEPILVIDTEHGSASKYADEFSFDVIELESFSPRNYIEALDLAEQHDYAVVIADSLSHAWVGKHGILEMVDEATARSRSKSTFSEGWRAASPEHNRLVERLLSLSARRHLICTMRSKMAYTVEMDERGKQQLRKIGMQPVQRDGLEYEFDIVADMDVDNTLIISKTRCRSLNKAVIPLPGIPLARTIKDWLTDGTAVVLTMESSVVTHPTIDQISSLIELARSVDVDLITFGHHIRRRLKLAEDIKVTKKFLHETMTMEQYDAAWGYYAELLKQAVEEDVQDFPPPEGAEGDETIAAQDSPDAEEHMPEKASSEPVVDGKDTEAGMVFDGSTSSSVGASSGSSNEARGTAEMHEREHLRLRQKAIERWQLPAEEVDHVLRHYPLTRANTILWQARKRRLDEQGTAETGAAGETALEKGGATKILE